MFPSPMMKANWRRFGTAIGLVGVLALPAAAQDPSLPVRVSGIEEQMRQLYGQIEQLTIQMGQLSAQLQRIQQDLEFRLEQLEGGGRKASGVAPKPGAGQLKSGNVPENAGGSEEIIGEAVDLGAYSGGLDQPAANGDSEMVGAIQKAPGPKPLGTLSGTVIDGSQPTRTLPGGVVDGTLSAQTLPGSEPSLLPEQVETASLGDSGIAADVPPEELYEQSYESLLRKRFGDAEAGFRTFASRHRDHELAGNAQYWLGETYYAQSNYKSAAQAFLTGYQSYPQGRKAPDSLLKLGMSLAQLGQKEQACTAYATVEVKFPRAAEARKRAQNELAKTGC